MKKIITLLCIAALTIGTTACGNSAESTAMESTTEVTTKITTAQATTKTTTKVTTTEKTVTTTSNVDTILNSSATINELSFGISSEWDHSSNDNRESWYANDRGMIMLMSFDDPSFSEFSDETLFSEVASTFYEESKNNNGNTDFSEAQNLKIAGCPAMTFDYAVINDDYNTKIRAFYIFHNECVYTVLVQMSVQGEPSELSYCVDKIIDSMAFKESTTESISNNVLMSADFKVANVMSGDNSTKLGEYGYINVSKEQLKVVSMEEYDEFCTKRVDDSDYNWVSIICEDGTGICFAGSLSYCATYGELDEEGSILQSTGTIMSNFDGTYTYTEN